MKLIHKCHWEFPGIKDEFVLIYTAELLIPLVVHLSEGQIIQAWLSYLLCRADNFPLELQNCPFKPEFNGFSQFECTNIIKIPNIKCSWIYIGTCDSIFKNFQGYLFRSSCEPIYTLFICCVDCYPFKYFHPASVYHRFGIKFNFSASNSLTQKY